jgi:hypothetical protein
MYFTDNQGFSQDHMAIFLAPTFWEPEQPLSQPVFALSP